MVEKLRVNKSAIFEGIGGIIVKYHFGANLVKLAAPLDKTEISLHDIYNTKSSSTKIAISRSTYSLFAFFRMSPNSACCNHPEVSTMGPEYKLE